MCTETVNTYSKNLETCLRERFPDIQLDEVFKMLKEIYHIETWEDIIERYPRTINPTVMFVCTDLKISECEEIVSYIFKTPTL